MKTKFKISFLILIFGWLPFIVLSIVVSIQIKVILTVIGVLVCVAGAMCFASLLNNYGFWMKQDELQKAIDEHKGAAKEYNEAKAKLIRKILEQP